MHGKKFTLLKFRTMMPEKSEKFIQATVNDSRVTRVGRLLRRTSLDELPQLINVLKGDMSVVGPRPHAPETSINGVKFEVAVQDYHRRYCVKPGITGLAQIRGLRGETTRIEMLEQRIASDLEYIKNWSIWLDLTIMIKTIPLIFSQENAY
jgi:lipopolysaccharide/colanic/teichoic acid biosynthesis glycosyltransferase